MKMTVVGSNPDTGLLTQQTFCFSSDVLAEVREVPVMTLSIARHRDLGL